MWLMVGFDLPTQTKEQVRFANRFRNDLLDLGFTRFQFSFYTYFLTSKERADLLATKIARLVPPNGHVCIFFITDKQFGMIRNYYGGRKVSIDVPEQGLLFE
jgi:CRISPR-associated protein Cas2